MLVSNSPFPFFRCFLTRGQSQPDLVYELLGQNHLYGKRTTYLNLGYWAQAIDYDQAAEQMTQLVGHWADLKTTDRVLDVGCGFGDQDLYWEQHYRPASIIALNICDSQVNHAKKSINKKKLNQKIRVIRADATALPFKGNPFDKIIALESAFHFLTRQKFFLEAFRTLKPGGQLTLADMIYHPNPKHWSFFRKLKRNTQLQFWQIPHANRVRPKSYLQSLKDCGFIDIETEDITDHTIPYFYHWLKKRIEEPTFKKRAHPLLRRLWAHSSKKFQTEDLNIWRYWLVKAKKPPK